MGAAPEYNLVSPERARNLELGASYLKEGLRKNNNKLRLHIALFDNHIKDYISRANVYSTSGYGVLGRVNLDYARMRGGELSLDYDAGGWFARYVAGHHQANDWHLCRYSLQYSL